MAGRTSVPPSPETGTAARCVRLWDGMVFTCQSNTDGRTPRARPLVDRAICAVVHVRQAPMRMRPCTICSATYCRGVRARTSPCCPVTTAHRGQCIELMMTWRMYTHVVYMHAQGIKQMLERGEKHIVIFLTATVETANNSAQGREGKATKTEEELESASSASTEGEY